MKQEIKKFYSWYLQAENDFAWAQSSLEHGYYSQVCYVSQEIGEKALKSIAFLRGFELIRTHSLAKLSRELKTNGEIEEASSDLDLYYISVRYPDNLPSGDLPFLHFTEGQASKSLAKAAMLLKKAEVEAITVMGADQFYKEKDSFISKA